MSPFRQACELISFTAICFAVAWIGSVFTRPSIGNWYRGLRKPRWTPPGWLFGPVWTVLYLSMAIAAWLVYRHVGLSLAAVPLAVFGVQLTLNLAWSLIFFGRHDIGLAFIDIILLWLAILATIFAFRPISIPAACLLVPYLVWVTFASALNLSILRMNR